MPPRSLRLCLPAICALLGCSSDDTPAPAPPAKTVYPDLPAGEQSPAVAPGTPRTVKRGAVTIKQARREAAVENQFHAVTATFQDNAFDTSGRQTCTTEVEGACRLSICKLDKTIKSNAEKLDWRDAGKVTVLGTDPLIELAFVSADVGYKGWREDGNVFGLGQPLAVVGAGSGSIPAFRVDVRTPDAFTIQKPAVNTGAKVKRSAPFTISWTGGETTPVVASFSATGPVDSQYVTSLDLECTFEGAAGSGVVPAELLAKMPAGRGDVLVNDLTISQTYSKIVAAGDYQITVTVDAGSSSAYLVDFL